MADLRLYRPGDLDPLYLIDTACFEPPFRFSRAVLQRFLNARHARTVVAESTSGVVGFITVHIQQGHTRRGYVVTLDVLPSQRRAGLGSRLLREAEQLASAAGAASMRLHVHTGNTVAHSFYHRMGYRHIETAYGYYGESLDALLLEKQLT